LFVTICKATGAAVSAALTAAVRARRPQVAGGGPARAVRVAAIGACALVLTGVLVPAASAAPAEPATAATASPWVAPRPGVFGLGDSLFLQCGDSLGLGSRSLGMIGWWGGTTRDMRARLSTGTGTWPYMTEPSHAEELANFRNAGSLVIGLGTNDAGLLSVAEYRANVDWFMTQAAGRPVEWLNVYKPGIQATTDQFNKVLYDAAGRYPNLRILDWQGYARANPGALHRDGLHIGSNVGCEHGRFRLIRDNAPAVAGYTTPDPTWVNKPTVIPAPNPVSVKYQQVGGRSGFLGAATSGLDCTRKNGGCVQFFTNGAIVWSPKTGARIVQRVVNDGWWWYQDMSTVGYPLEDTVCGLRDGGCRQRFETGTFYWRAGVGAQWVIDPMRGRHSAMGAETGRLGYPTTESRCNSVTLGCYQRFQGGVVSWRWSVPEPPTAIYGAIRQRWNAAAGADGPMGYPVAEEKCGLTRGGCTQDFSWGTITWSPQTGARAVFGAIRDRWNAGGAQAGMLGYPVAEERCGLARGGCTQDFEGGVVTWSPQSGARAIYGAIRQRWNAAAGADGPMGYPVAEEICGLADGGCRQDFSWGTITWSPATGARAVFGAIRQRWDATGAASGSLGYPAAEERCGLTGGGCAQTFQRGAVYWSASSGAHGVTGRIRSAWDAAGAERGRYGYPRTDEQVVDGRIAQTFQGGTISAAR
jgi:uncharacterized protein with LGFP repeats